MFLIACFVGAYIPSALANLIDPTEKALLESRDRLARSLGYRSYEDQLMHELQRKINDTLIDAINKS